MKALTRKTDFPALESIRRDMDRFFDDLVPISWRIENGGKMNVWTPNTDMSENDEEYVLTADLPGMSKKEIEINLQDNRLTISGERKKEAKEEKGNFLREERFYGRFVRSFTLPAAILEDKVKATFKDGVLTVHVPKAEAKKPKTVAID